MQKMHRIRHSQNNSGSGSPCTKSVQDFATYKNIAGSGHPMQKMHRIRHSQNNSGSGSVWLERYVRDVEVVGSSPTSPTSIIVGK